MHKLWWHKRSFCGWRHTVQCHVNTKQGGKENQ